VIIGDEKVINIGGLMFNNVDYMLVVDKDLTVVYNTRIDKRVGASYQKLDDKEYINKHLFEIYPSLKQDSGSSSIVKCLTTGEIVVKKFQKFKDFNGNSYITHNVTIPIMRDGNIIGAVELAKDIKTIDNIKNDSIEQHEYQEVSESLGNLNKTIENISFDEIITNDSKMQKAIEQAKIMSLSQNPNLIYGETGTGKEVFVQAMINYSGVSRKKVVIQNCAALPENLIESILFGTYKGAYTGAENRKGLFEAADGGIIFLDELNSIPYDVQGKLLRVLQDGSFRPVGSNEQKKVKVKVIAAMNEDPLEAIKNNRLRKDLFYRLSSGMIYLPPLRERKGDIKLFVENYLREFNLIYDKDVKGITKDLENFLYTYDWYGNVRELKHLIETMVSLTNKDELDIHDLPAYMYDRIYKTEKFNYEEKKQEDNNDIIEKSYSLQEMVEDYERTIIENTLKSCGTLTDAANKLKLTKQALNYKLNKYKIRP
jgi:arginine utilization regulatory protein